MEYLADTVAIVRYFGRVGKLGKDARRILREADKGGNTIFISIISLVEILYLSERNRIQVNFDECMTKLERADNYSVLDLDMAILDKAKRIDNLELHDRLIVATAVYMGIPILTSDEKIKKSGDVIVIW